MEKYIQQLFTDLRIAHRSESDEPISSPKTIEDEFNEIDDWLSGRLNSNALPFGEVCGIEKSQFPPVEKLTSQQMEFICCEIEQLLFSWNITLDLPDLLPIETIYKFHLQCFEEKIMIVDSGNVGFSFCDEIPEECIFREHCSCLKNRQEFETDRKLNKEKADFFIEKLATLYFSKSAAFQVKLNTSEPPFQKSIKTQPLAQWLGFEIEQIPVSYKISEEQTAAIMYFLLKLWDENDQIDYWMQDLEAYEKYELWEDYLASEVWFDGKETLFFVESKVWTLEPKKEEGLSFNELFLDEEEEDESTDFDLPF